jgi:hypothetical protein
MYKYTIITNKYTIMGIIICIVMLYAFFTGDLIKLGK